MYRELHAAPTSRLPAGRRGPVVGRFCTVCGAIYPQYRGRHSGKPLYGKDHVASPCAHEGDVFAAGEPWWEPAVEVLAPPPPVVDEAAAPRGGEGAGAAG